MDEEKKVIRKQLQILYESLISKYLDLTLSERKKIRKQVISIIRRLENEGCNKSRIYCFSKCYALKLLRENKVAYVREELEAWENR